MYLRTIGLMLLSTAALAAPAAAQTTPAPPAITRTVVAATKLPQITLITCYPFDWVGPAPYRLVVEALPAAEGVPPRPASFPTHPVAAASAR